MTQFEGALSQANNHSYDLCRIIFELKETT